MTSLNSIHAEKEHWSLLKFEVVFNYDTFFKVAQSYPHGPKLAQLTVCQKQAPFTPFRDFTAILRILFFTDFNTRPYRGVHPPPWSFSRIAKTRRRVAPPGFGLPYGTNLAQYLAKKLAESGQVTELWRHKSAPKPASKPAPHWGAG